ncbi:hypothetical protein RHGRI_026152 [Rhododendron griersonianum]|uniref:Ribonuclease H1 N-terminal domain-containing protein n=1 Tax=Rhododendron griersonianum TaxID=479676 RepID=A0AAV6IRL7_9ERIC|nr:hypothetical protein RHGRI_026152 [Rhododendron griersonianum]
MARISPKLNPSTSNPKISALLAWVLMLLMGVGLISMVVVGMAGGKKKVAAKRARGGGSNRAAEIEEEEEEIDSHFSLHSVYDISTGYKMGKWYVVFVGWVLRVYDSWAEAHGQTTGFKHSSFKGYETEAEARKAYSTYLSKRDGSSSEKSDDSHDQQALAHQLKIALEQRDKLQEELDDLRAKLGSLALG